MFWRTDPIPPREKELYEAVMHAHGASAYRENASTVGLLNSYAGSGDYVQALIGALSTLGGKHAPLAETYKFIKGYIPTPDGRYLGGYDGICQGWGNSFEKGHPDPLWTGVEEALDGFPIGARIREITESLHSAGKMVFPNPSAFTAGAAIALKCPVEVIPWFFVAGRISSWSQLLLAQEKK